MTWPDMFCGSKCCAAVPEQIALDDRDAYENTIRIRPDGECSAVRSETRALVGWLRRRDFVSREDSTIDLSYVLNNRRVPNQELPIFVAISEGDEALVHTMVQHGANISLYNLQGCGAMKYAIIMAEKGGNRGILRSLIGIGPDS